MTKATQAQIYEYFSRELWENNHLKLDENILIHLPADAVQDSFKTNLVSVKFSDGSSALIEVIDGAGSSFEIV